MIDASHDGRDATGPAGDASLADAAPAQHNASPAALTTPEGQALGRVVGLLGAVVDSLAARADATDPRAANTAPAASGPPLLYLFANGEALSFARDERGLVRSQHEEELPESLYEDSDEGTLMVFDGTIHHGTQDQTEEALEARGLPPSARHYAAWWAGSMRPATDAEILAVIGTDAARRGVA